MGVREVDFSSTGPTRAGTGQSHELEISCMSPKRWQRLKYLKHLLLLFRHITRELNQQQRSQDLNQHSNAGISNGGLTCCTTMCTPSLYFSGYSHPLYVFCFPCSLLCILPIYLWKLSSIQQNIKTFTANTKIPLRFHH